MALKKYISIQHIYGTETELTTDNRILLKGQVAFSDNGTEIRQKVGDGVTAYNDLSFVGGSASISPSRTLTINGDDKDLSADREWRVAQADTGCLTSAGLTANSTTTINIGAVVGYVVDNETDPANPTYTKITYAGETGKTVTTAGSGLSSYVMLGVGGVISFQNTFPTSAERKAKIWLGKVGHPTGVITTVINEPDFITSPQAFSRDLFQALGPYINTGVYPYANGANLSVNITAGSIRGNGINFVGSAANRQDPDKLNVGPFTPLSFLYRTRTGAGGTAVTLITPDSYDLAGVITPIGGGVNRSTIQYIFCIPGVGFVIQYGQNIYNTLTDAISFIGRESFTVFSNLPDNAILIGVLAVKRSATNLSDETQAQFFNADKLGQIIGATSGVSVGTMQTGYNNSLAPQITTSTALGAVQYKRGSAADTDNVLQVLNGAGTATYSVKGSGTMNITSSIYEGHATESDVAVATSSSKTVTPASLATELYKLNQLFYSTDVAEDRVRRANVSWAYAGTVRTVGSGGTYATISAAISAASSGDIIQLFDGTYNTASEPSGYLLINDTSKRLLIRGNASNNSAVVIQQSSAAAYCVRLRTASQVTFQNLKITTNQSNAAAFINVATAASPVTYLFDNCILEQTGVSAVNTVHMDGGLSNNNYHEFKNCKIYTNNHASSMPIGLNVSITDALAATYTNPILITGSELYGWMNFGDSAVNITMYDTACIQRQLNSPVILAVGADISVPSNSTSQIDIRSCSFRDENNFQGHAVLLGRGTKNVYFVNNYIFIGPVADSLSLGIVIKSTPTSLGAVVIDGNYIEAPRPLYVKGGQNCYIRYNRAISNWPDLTNGYGLALNNPNNPDGPISSTGNVVTHNNLRGKIGALHFDHTSGAVGGDASAKLCFFNNNIYSVSNGTTYIAGDDPEAWITRGNFWTQDTNSRFIELT